MPSVRSCPRCGSHSAARHVKCQDCGASLSGTIPFDSSTVPPPEAVSAATAADQYEDVASTVTVTDAHEEAPAAEEPREDSRYDGVHGWLKLIVIGNLYIAPIAIALQYVLAWIGFVLLAEDYPGILLVALIVTVVDGALTYMGIRVAIALRDIRQGAVQQMKHLLQLRLGWAFVGGLITFIGWSFVGLDAEAVIPDALRGMLIGVVGFAVAWTYFSVSRRVKATYPDWRD